MAAKHCETCGLNWPTNVMKCLACDSSLHTDFKREVDEDEILDPIRAAYEAERHREKLRTEFEKYYADRAVLNFEQDFQAWYDAGMDIHSTSEQEVN